MKTILYYFTGTGNSMKIAQELSAKIPGSELRSFAVAYRLGILDTEAENIGFVFPVYNSGVPLAFRRLLEKTQFSTDTYIFSIANYGCLPGDALYQAEALIAQSGGRMNAGHLIQMPDNYLPMMDVPKVEVQSRYFEEMERKIARIAARTIQKQNDGIEESKYRIDRFLAVFKYQSVYKFSEMDRHFWVTESCAGCGFCVTSCPFDNLMMSDRGPEWNHRCEMCMRCIHICPNKAIQYKKITLKRKRYIHPHVRLEELVADGCIAKTEE